MKTTQVFLGVLAGVAAGALAGILFAPEKGSETRKKIVSKGEEYADTMQDKFEGLAETIGKKYDTTRQEAEEFIAKGRSKFDEVKKDGKSVAA